jgi:hypothetical protein
MKFTVTITRTAVASLDVEIEAGTSKEAVHKALDEAGDVDFQGACVDYEFGCDGVAPDDGTWDSWDQGDLDDDDDDDGDPADQVMRVAQDMVRGTGVKAELCHLCQKAELPDDLPAAIDAGWLPSYEVNQEECEGPVCPTCVAQFLRCDGEGDDVLNLMGEYGSQWDGGVEVKSPCMVDPRTRKITIEHASDVEGLQTLEREYVQLNGVEYEAANEAERDRFTPEEQSEMFFWE